MKKLFAAAIVGGLAVGAASPVLADPMDVAFANTVVITATGSVIGETPLTLKYFYEPDGTVTTDQGASGTWQRTPDGHCTDIPQLDVGMPRKICGPLGEGTDVGTKWEFQPAEGLTIQGEIVAGR